MRYLALHVFVPAVAALAAIAPPAPAAGQTTHDEQVWLNLTVTGRASGKLIYFAEAQPRIGDGVSRLDQLLLRPAIGWQASPTVQLFQGYAHVVVPVAGGRDRNEERSFQQVTWFVRPGATEVQSRTRLEQRWLSNGRDLGWRLREILRAETPLAPTTQVKALGYVEAFVALNDTDWGARGGFDQLRALVGVEVPVRGRTTVEAGYLNQTINDPGGRARMRHVAALSLFVRP